MEMFEVLEGKKEELLKQALACYERTLKIFDTDGIEEGDVDERWLVYFMIGKIKEKYSTPIVDCLNIYLTSMEYLKRNKVVLPRKISYDSPQSFALEALEVYYRVHASTLKHLAKVEASSTESIDTDTRRKIYEIIRRIQLDPLYNTNAKTDKTARFVSEKQKKRDAAMPLNNLDSGGGLPDTSHTGIMRDVLEVSLVDKKLCIPDPDTIKPFKSLRIRTGFTLKLPLSYKVRLYLMLSGEFLSFSGEMYTGRYND
jgi:hypothetical protein